jgi:hypothetical protein
MRLGALTIAAGLTALILSTSAGHASDRVALVVGNGTYQHSTSLKNPANDATDIAAALRRLGFDVLVGTDLSSNGMRELLRSFSDKLDHAKIALFFYAGHGLQIDGHNYLVPVDARLSKVGDVSLDAINLSAVLQQMESFQRTSLVFLDACRNNPLAERLARSVGRTRSQSIGRGFARVESGAGTMIAFATAPDTEADDGGDGRNSPFTTALLEHIASPGLDVALVMRRVRSGVMKSTANRQVPWDHSSLTDTVILAPEAAPSPSLNAGPPRDQSVPSTPSARRESEALCDEFAGFRSDPDRPESHKWQDDYANIPVGQALTHCKLAHDNADNNKTKRRMLVQLGRTYAALGREAAVEKTDFAAANGFFADAVRHWEQAAELNSGQAHNVLGAYKQGAFSLETKSGPYQPVNVDLAVAFKHYVRAADLGNPTGVTNVGLVLVGVDDRFKVPLDHRKGLFYLEQGKRLGVAGAYFGAGVARIRGSGVEPNEQAGVQDIAVAYCKNDRRAYAFFEKSRNYRAPACVGENVASVEKIFASSAPLSTPGPSAGGVVEVTARAFDGHWYSPEWKYSYQLRSGIGTATSTNSTNFKPGDVIVRIRPTGPNSFAGEQVYRDGRWYKIKGSMRTDGRLYIEGERNVSWAMERIR